MLQLYLPSLQDFLESFEFLSRDGVARLALGQPSLEIGNGLLVIIVFFGDLYLVSLSEPNLQFAALSSYGLDLLILEGDPLLHSDDLLLLALQHGIQLRDFLNCASHLTITLLE